MKTRILIAFLLVAFGVSACAGIRSMSQTVSWDEDVLLSDGQMLPVYRTAEYYLSRLNKQTIIFSYKGQHFKWENDDRWLIDYMPDILDIVNDIPILVMPVHRWGPCYKYGFPPEGLVAFAYQKGSWGRIAIAELPKTLRVNLLRSTHEIRYWDEYKGKRVTPQMKQKVEGNTWGTSGQGQLISEASRRYAGYDDSCIRMRPLPNKPLEEARQRNTEAERAAPTIQAVVKSVSITPEIVSKKAYLDQKGLWTGAGYLNASCKGIVDYIELLMKWSGDEKRYGATLIGYQLLLTNTSTPADRKKVQIEEASGAQMQCVVCDKTGIFAVRRQSKKKLIVHRFSRNGELVDAFRIVLPDTEKIVTDPDWGTLWTVVPDTKGNLSISVVNYSPLTANLGGTIQRRIDYVIPLPVPQASVGADSQARGSIRR